MAEVKMPGDENRTKGAENLVYREDYPRNSNPEPKTKTISESTGDAKNEINMSKIPPKAKRVTQTKAVVRKPSFGKKLIRAFAGDDVVDVKSYLINEVAIPTIKNLVCDIFEYGPQMILFGEVRSRGRRDRRDSNRSYVSYDRCYDRDRRDNRDRDRRQVRSTRYDAEEIILSTRGEAEAVISDLCDRIEDYGQATVADLYDMVGMTSSNFTTQYWGWDDRTAMRMATYRRVRDGWLLLLPEAVNLK